MRSVLRIYVALVVVGVAASAWAQPPTELSSCLGAENCREILSLPIIIDCDFSVTWGTLVGRAVWGPLTYVGPIRVSLEARPYSDNGFPLYFEVRPTNGATACNIKPGSIQWQTQGTMSCDPDSMWVSSPWISLPWLDLGETYWVQLLGLATIGFPDEPEPRYSPGLRCIRVESRPSSIEFMAWTRVKRLYQ